MVEKNDKSGKLSIKVKKMIHGQRMGVDSGEVKTGKSVYNNDTITAAETGKGRGKGKQTIQTTQPSSSTHIINPIRNVSHLVIKEDELKKIREDYQLDNVERDVPQVAIVTVRKAYKQGPVKKVTVLRPADVDAEIKPPDFTNYAGPRFDSDGKFIEYSILGNLEDFCTEAQRRGEFQHLYNTNDNDMGKGKKKRKEEKCSQLLQWKKQNSDWQNTVNYLAARVGRPREDLVMKSGNAYPAWVDDRTKVAVALDATTSGYGAKRERSRFFKQRDRIGNDLDGIFSTLRKSDAGDLEPLEIMGVPSCIREEKGNDSWDIGRTYPVYQTSYLQTQKEKVKDIIHITQPYHPVFDELAVIGKDVERKIEDIPVQSDDRPEICSRSSSQGKITLHSPNLFAEIDKNFSCGENLSMTSPMLAEENTGYSGPAIKISGNLVAWEGEGHSRKGQVQVTLSVLFDGTQGEKLMQYLEIENVGTASIHYEWARKPAINPFNIARARIQRFYLSHEGGVLAPGRKLVLPIVFKSELAGIFSETWKFETVPTLCTGADILVNLKSIIKPENLYVDEIECIEENLIRRKGATIVKEIVEEMVDTVVSPEHIHPILPDVTDATKFEKENPGVRYHGSTLNKMMVLYRLLQDVFPDAAPPKSQFSLKNLRKAIILLTDLEEGDIEGINLWEVILEADEEWNYTKRRLLWRYLRHVNTLLFPCPMPSLSKSTAMYNLGYRELQIAIDKFTASALFIAEKMDLPMKTEEEEAEEEINKTDKKKGKKGSNAPTPKMKKSGGSKETDAGKAVSPNGKILSNSLSKRGKRSITPSSMMMDSAASPKEEIVEKFCPVLKNNVSVEKMNVFREKLYLKAFNILYEVTERITTLAEQKSA